MISQDILQKEIGRREFGILGVAVVALLCYWLQSSVHLNHDVSYFVHFSRRLLQGARLGVDIHDGNLPMVWGLFTPPAALAQLGLASEATAVRWFVLLYFLLSAGLLAMVTARVDATKRAGMTGWLIAFTLAGTLGACFSFGQREHGSVLFAMPYLAVVAFRLQGQAVDNRWLKTGVGVLAGIGFTLKPHFLLVPALIELLVLARLGWKSWFRRAEMLAMGVTVAVYVLVCIFVFGDYLAFTLGLTKAAYWAFGTASFPVLLDRYVTVAAPALFAFVIALITRTWSWQHTVVLLAGIGYSILYFLQMKGFVYHAYPVLVCALTLLGISVATGFAKAWQRWQSDRKAGQAVLMAAVVLLALPSIGRLHNDIVRWYANYNIAWGPTGQLRQAVIYVVDHFAPTRDSYFFAFSMHPFPGYPTASYTQAEYAGRSISQTLIPAYARLDEVKDPAVRAGVLKAAELQRRMVIEDFERHPPSIVFAEGTRARMGLNGRLFDDIAFYSQDPRFREIWANYDEYPPLGPLRVFVRRGADPLRPLPK